MSTFDERVKVEFEDLKTRIASLQAFIDSPKLLELPDAEQHRLRRQATAMSGYLVILAERFAANFQ